MKTQFIYNLKNIVLATSTEDATKTFKNMGINYGASILESIALILVGIIVAKLIVGLIRAIFGKTKVDGAVISFITSIIKAAIALLIFFLILRAFKIDATSIAAIAGASGIAVGFALKDSLSNLASGVMLLVTKPFKQDDIVEISGFTGSVKKIKITTTELLTADNTTVIIPNNKMVLNEIVNYSTKPTRRVDLIVEVSYKYDMDEVISVLHKAMDDEPNILKNPAGKIEVTALHSHAIEYKMKMWTKTEDYFSVKNNFYSTILRHLIENNIKEALPVYEYVKREPSNNDINLLDDGGESYD